MYLDYSLQKIGILGSIICMLFLSVYATNEAKVHAVGSTPYFYTIRVGATYFLQSVAAEIAKASGGMFASAAASQMEGAGALSSSREKAAGVPVLTYHRVLKDTDVNNVSVEAFRDQMKTLKAAGWNTVTLEEFEAFIRGERELPEKSFLLTFDDGAKDSFYPVDPILRELDYHGVMYVIVQSSKTPESTYYLTPEEIKLMLATGRWSIGSHSYDGHRPYGTDELGATGIFFADRIWNRAQARLETPEEFTARVHDDLTRADAELEATYGRTINTLAFPLGNETGLEGANNFHEGASITEAQARTLYALGMVQTNDQTYTFNFPSQITPEFNPAFPLTTSALATDFIVRRIHVDYDWDGARLLAIMENGIAKGMPYEDDFTTNRGWIPAWGAMDIGRNNLQLRAEPDTSSAGIFLDGSALWDDYSFDAAMNWHTGFAVLAADVLDSKTYHACAFEPGKVLVQEIVGGEVRTLEEKEDPRIAYGDAISAGIRVHDDVIECTWNYESLVESYERSFSGGIGIQSYNPILGTAELNVSSVIVRPYGAE